MKNKKGFTIIELIVVIAIIAILAAIVMVGVTQYIAKARDAKVKSDISQIAKDAMAKYADAMQTGSATFVGYTVGTNIKPPCDPVATYTFNGSATAFAVFHKECQDASKYWCADSTGKNLELTGCSAAPSGYACVCGSSTPNPCADGVCSDGECSSCPNHGDCQLTNAPSAFSSKQLASSIYKQLAAVERCCNDNDCGTFDDTMECQDCVNNNPSECGDGSCDENENSASCCVDCGCSSGEICQGGICILNSVQCNGDGICDPGENETCPDDNCGP